jgi:hypothetical protein
MPSRSWLAWDSGRSAALDEIESAHGAVGGSGPGTRLATQQINQAYVVLLASHFQGFCRNLHTESVDYMAQGITPAGLGRAVRAEFLIHRRLDAGNANPGSIGADFGRLGSPSGMRCAPTTPGMRPGRSFWRN